MKNKEKTFLDRVVEVLKKEKKHLTAREIATKIGEIDPLYKEKRLRETAQKLPFENILTSEVYTAVRWKGEKLGILRSGDKPALFSLDMYDEKTNIAKIKTSSNFMEKDMYPLLSEYLKEEKNIHSKRIDEKTSSNTHGQKGNQWLHPDVVGLRDTNENFSEELKALSKKAKIERCELFSFEVKTDVDMASARENFFQTLANSSWANYSYLVVSGIKDNNTREELSLLCTSFGVGLIRLGIIQDAEEKIKLDWEKCEEIVPARKKELLDLALMNRLAQENGDFKKYIKLIEKFYDDWSEPNDWDYKK